MRYSTKPQALFVCSLALVLVFVTCPPAARAQAVSYFVTDLGTLGGSDSRAYAINSAGQVVGSSSTATSAGSLYPFSWQQGFTDIGSFGGSGGDAFAVNEIGYAAGSGDTETGGLHPFVWSSVFGKRDLGTLGGAFATAWDINNSSQVVGQSEVSSLIDRAFIWTSTTGLQQLGTLGGSSSTARGINETGQITGCSTTGTGQTHAFVYSGGVMTDIGTLGGSFSFATEISDDGKVVGYSTVSTGGINPPSHAFLYTPGVGMRDLGTLGGNFSAAFDIDNRGHVVGYADVAPGVRHAFIYDAAGGMRDLNNFIAPGTGWVLTEAQGINSKGEIVGLGINPSGFVRAFLLTPAIDEFPPPEPVPCFVGSEQPTTTSTNTFALKLTQPASTSNTDAVAANSIAAATSVKAQPMKAAKPTGPIKKVAVREPGFIYVRDLKTKK